jgi:serine/threonine protein kinase
LANTGYIDIRVIAQTNKYVVYETARIKDQRPFARKQLRPEYELVDADRFRNEARLLARLDHPNIVRVIDQQLADSPLFVVTPLYQQNLREWLGNHSSASETHEADIEDVFARILDAVAYAHEQGVIHRDLKPENILLNSPRDLVVIDFNISVSSEGLTQRLTPHGQALGTPHYIAPEQLRDASSVDQRTDIYSLGIILYELHGGKVGSSTLDFQDLPLSIASIVERCTNADRAKRFPCIRDLIRAWRLACDLNTKQSEINELEIFMLEDGHISTTRAEGTLALLEAYADDDDLLDKFFMESSQTAITALADCDVSRLERLVRRWTKFFSEASWPFSYTDEIARRCEQLWFQIKSVSVKAELVTALIILANRHHRYFVWRAAARLIEEDQSKEYVDQLIQRMIVLDEDELAFVADYLAKARISPTLRTLFEPKSQEFTG